MKKTFQKTLVALALLGSGSLVTSCSEDSPWLSGLVNVISNVLGITNADNTYQFQGTGNLTMYAYNISNNTYNPETARSVNPTLTINVQTEAAASANENGYIQFTISTPFGVDGTNIQNLVFTTYLKDGKIDPDGGTYLTGGTCTYNGTANTAINAACFEGTITDSQLKLTNIYFQVGDKLFKGTFTGSIVNKTL